MAKAQIHELRPQPTIKAAVNAAKAHVQAVNAAARSKGNSGK